MNMRRSTRLLVFTLASFLCRILAAALEIGPPQITLDGKPAPRPSMEHAGVRAILSEHGPQMMVLSRPASWLGVVGPGIDIVVQVPIKGAAGPTRIRAEVLIADCVGLSLGIEGQKPIKRVLRTPDESRAILELDIPDCPPQTIIQMRLAGQGSAWWRNITIESGGTITPITFTFPEQTPAPDPAPMLPPLRPALEQFLIEWDWRLQDGIDTPRQPSSYDEAIRKTIDRGDKMIAESAAQQNELAARRTTWTNLKSEYQLAQTKSLKPDQWEDLWRRVHVARRQIFIATGQLPSRPIAFIKHTPVIFSHQLTQYYGSCARPGGGVFILESPGQSMRVRELAPELPKGSFQHLDVSFDGQRLLFAHCDAKTTPKNREQYLDRFFHLYEVNTDGSGLRQITRGAFDDFSPRYLPDGKIIFTSTRRGGFHRCGRGPCPVFTLCTTEPGGAGPRVISFHETHEWDPALLNDGRIVYTRWDYVDRNAVHYQQLWACRPDGSNVQIYYGNNTLNPVGVWEPRAIPGTSRILATAAAHHAMTAGSIIRLDTSRGLDGLDPITRLTPDALFPESEAPVLREAGKPGAWHAPVGVKEKITPPAEALRWPGHCYKSPWPLSEQTFLASYSYDPLIGEPNGNKPNMFGLYLADAFGNKELLYRDLNVSSLWAMPIGPRTPPPQMPAPEVAKEPREGTFFLQNVYSAWPILPRDQIKRLRIVQVLPKSTPHINAPTVGLASASSGKQVLGTVPVEADGSAYFRAPAGIPLCFQALDEHGQAVQIMRSITYLQPGERVSCVGCHEHRTTVPTGGKQPIALSRAPSAIEPGPDGSNPLSYPLLVQPVLDAKCVSCHNKNKPDGKVILTGEGQGHFTASYHALVARVPFAAWGNGLSMQANSEPATIPDHFGARGSKFMKSLLAGHYDVKLTPADIERLVTWMDANALFYGTFDEKDQARQIRGERIEGPRIQ